MHQSMADNLPFTLQWFKPENTKTKKFIIVQIQITYMI
jgi:hypothetical protein